MSRKRLGQIYGFRKRVSAVALLDCAGVEQLHATVVQMAADGCAAWEALAREQVGGARRAGGEGRTWEVSAIRRKKQVRGVLCCMGGTCTRAGERC